MKTAPVAVICVSAGVTSADEERTEPAFVKDFAISGILAAGCWVDTGGESEVGTGCAVACRGQLADGALDLEPDMRQIMT